MIGFGGQTALNCAIAIADRGVLEEHGIRVLGTPMEAIRDTEDRGRFIRRMAEIGVETPRSRAVTNLLEAKCAAIEIGYPIMVRIAFALGGLGSGMCRD